MCCKLFISAENIVHQSKLKQDLQINLTFVAFIYLQEDFCLFVGERYSHLDKTVPEAGPDVSWQVKLTDMIKKMEEAIFY